MPIIMNIIPESWYKEKLSFKNMQEAMTTDESIRLLEMGYTTPRSFFDMRNIQETKETTRKTKPKNRYMLEKNCTAKFIMPGKENSILPSNNIPFFNKSWAATVDNTDKIKKNRNPIIILI